MDLGKNALHQGHVRRDLEIEHAHADEIGPVSAGGFSAPAPCVRATAVTAAEASTELEMNRRRFSLDDMARGDRKTRFIVIRPAAAGRW